MYESVILDQPIMIIGALSVRYSNRSLRQSQWVEEVQNRGRLRLRLATLAPHRIESDSIGASVAIGSTANWRSSSETPFSFVFPCTPAKNLLDVVENSG